MPNKNHEHVDKLGQQLALDDVVAYPDGNSMCIGIVKKLNPKQISINRVHKQRWGNNIHYKYPEDLVKIPGELATIYIIKNQD